MSKYSEKLERRREAEAREAEFGAELYSLYRLAFGLYDRLAADFQKYAPVMTAIERGSVKALRDLAFNISRRIDETIESRNKKGGAK